MKNEKLMFIYYLFDFMRKFNADSPGFVEARWIVKHANFSGQTAKILALRCKGKSLEKIAESQGLNQKKIKKALLDAADRARSA